MAKRRLKPFAAWLAAWVGLTILPAGFSMFDNEMAKAHGVERAAMHQKIKGWQEYNRRQGKRSHFRHDRWWTYGTPEYWFKNEFIWSSISTIRRAFNDLEKAGLMAIERVDGQLWLSALAGETVNLTTAPTNLQMSLFNVESDAPNWRSSIEESTTLKQAKVKRQSTGRVRAGVRKDVVADFQLPEHREQIAEQAEARNSGQEGDDILARLPGELVTGWFDTKVSIGEFVDQYGVEDIRTAWALTTTYTNRIAGTRSLLANAPTPRSAPSHSPANNDATEPDHMTQDDASQTPDVDAWVQDQFRALREHHAKPVFELSAETILPEQANWWQTTYQQLEIQLDRGSFETWFRDSVQLVAVEGAVWQFKTKTQYTADMLQHRLYREIRRVLSDVIGCRKDEIELRFDVAEAVNS